jgi:hypothetical protein
MIPVSKGESIRHFRLGIGSSVRILFTKTATFPPTPTPMGKTTKHR